MNGLIMMKVTKLCWTFVCRGDVGGGPHGDYLLPWMMADIIA